MQEIGDLKLESRASLGKAQGTCWRMSGMYAVLVLALAVHVSVVRSIFCSSQSLIYPLHADTIHCRQASGFYAIYHAGVNARQDVTPYGNNKDGVTPYFYPFRYLPIVAHLAIPLTYLTPHQAYMVWSFTLEGLLGVLLATLYRAMMDKRIWGVTTALLLLSSPYFLELHMGQFTFAMAVLCALALLLPRGGWLTYTLSVLLKPVGMVMVPALVRERRFWILPAVMIVALVVGNAPLFAADPGSWDYFVAANFKLRSGYGIGNYGLVQLASLVAQDVQWAWGVRNWYALVGVMRLVWLGMTALLVLCARRDQVVVGACTLLLAHFLTYPQVWEHHMSAVLVIGALLLTTERPARWVLPVILAAMVCLALPSPYGLFDTVRDARIVNPALAWPRYAAYVIVLPKILPTLVLFATGVWLLCREGLQWPWLAVFPRPDVCHEQ